MSRKESKQGWKAYLGLTMLGQLGRALPMDRSSGTVKMTLNGHDEIKIVTPTSSLQGIGRQWRSVRSGCLVVTYTDAVGVERIVSAGPICKPVAQDRRKGTVTIEAKGPTWLLEDRIVLAEDYQPQSSGGVGQLRTSVVGMTDRSFRAIISRILRHTVTEKRQGFLPLALPSEHERGDHDRTYDGYNVANNGAWKRISEITEVIGGPDVQFRPYWRDEERTRFGWEVVVGTDAQQTLPQDREINWDSSTPGGPVASIEVTSSADTVAHRVYATGAGEGSTVAMSMAEFTEIPEYMPLVEAVISDSDEEQDAEDGSSKLLTSKAQAALLNNAIDQISLDVWASPKDWPIGSWWCGEQARVTTKGWLDVPDGEHKLRIIAASYDIGQDVVSIETQEDYFGEDLQW